MTDIAERLGNLIECEMDKAQCELYATAKAEIDQLRMQLADHGETITRLQEQLKVVRELRDCDMREIERLHRADERWRQDYREARAEIERLRAALQTVRAENDRAKRQFTNISNKILDDACRALELKP